ncbi:MAG TPA: methylenetetrahydrofolate reductase [Steroidobacteraceae bacterium]|nr:methylenetetrahydrofolate reductase [Steroidobacteraceae bacterium]
MSLRDALRAGRFAVTTELPAVADGTVLLDLAAPLRGLVDAIQVAEGPASRPHLAPLVAAATLQGAGFHPALHLSCRDRNRVALQADLIGAANLGIETLLITRGNRMRPNARSQGEGVFEMGATDLIAAARALADSETPQRFGLARAPEFFIGGALTVFDPAPGWYPRSPLTKLEAGAQYLVGQPCFDMAILRRYMKALVAAGVPRRAHVVATLAVLPSLEIARRMRDTVRGMLIPEDVMGRLKAASDGERTGVDLCAEMLAEIATMPGLGGVHLLAAGDTSLIRAAVESSRVRAISAPPE